MKLALPGAPHLTYCTNIHPGESWEEVRRNLDRYTLEVKRRVAPEEPFGLGLRLSARAARALARPAELNALREHLAATGLYLFTFNGFPYGPFHGEPVKEQVYLPDWTQSARVAYTDQLADILAALLPDDGSTGTISTVPGAFRSRVPDTATAGAIARMLAKHAEHLFHLRERTGRSIVLALEPEPWCYLERAEEAVTFILERLWSREVVRPFAASSGLGEGAAETFLREHIGVCLDTCHMAVEYEDCRGAIRAVQAAGVSIAKIQVTAGLQVDFDGTPDEVGEKLDALASFAEGVYLHQVVERRGDRVRKHLDLPAALADWRTSGPPEECRVHFHVPVFREALGPFRGTQPYVADLLDLVREQAVAPHLELETYTWDVLPEAYRRETIVEAVAGELAWVLERLRR